MGWWNIVKTDFWFDLKGLRFASVDDVFTFYEEFNQTLQDAEALTMRLESDALESGDMEYEIEERYMEENGSVNMSFSIAMLIFREIYNYRQRLPRTGVYTNDARWEGFILGFLSRANNNGLVQLGGKLKAAVDNFSRDV